METLHLHKLYIVTERNRKRTKKIILVFIFIFHIIHPSRKNGIKNENTECIITFIYYTVIKMSREKLHIQRPSLNIQRPPLNIQRPIKVELDHYLCQCCFRSVPSTDFAALADSSNPIVPHCMKCLMRECCVMGCQKTYDPEYICRRNKVPFKTCCIEHCIDSHKCHHSVECNNIVTFGSFCDAHRCQEHMENGCPCFAERVSGQQLCAFHLLHTSEKHK